MGKRMLTSESFALLAVLRIDINNPRRKNQAETRAIQITQSYELKFQRHLVKKLPI
jgi:hypothetical protein